MSATSTVTRWVALLRAINVGGHTVKMAQLRQLFEDAGFAGVETFIASGNVIFSAPGARASLEAKVEKVLKASLGYGVDTFLRTAGEIGAVARHEPFEGALALPKDQGMYVGFVKAPLTPAARAALGTLADDLNGFHVNGSEVYWHMRTRFSDSTISGARIERVLGQPATFRNITSVRKLAAKAGGEGE